ncbi:hypothetical protein CBL_08994 [Carabus blaptoides fortunei]
MAVFLDIPSSWILVFCSSVFSLILFVFICVCWQSRKKSNQAYVMDSNEASRTELANNNVPQVLAQNKQKYFYHGVTYSSINNPDELANQADTFSFNILSIFRNIQRNKYSESTSDLNKVLTDNLDDSHTDTMHKNFEKSVLCLNSNDSNTSRSLEKDEAFSCISADSKTTFTSVRPIYNRSHSVADTFKSTLSDY